MKKIGILLIAIIGLFSSCVSLGTITDYSMVDPLGIVSIYANENIGWYGEEPQKDGILNNLAENAILESDNDDLKWMLSRTDELINQAGETLNNKLRGITSAAVIDKATLLASTIYTQENEIMSDNHISAEGYKRLRSPDKKFSAEINHETGIKGIVYINFSITKEIRKGIGKNGTMGANIQMYVSIVNPEGKLSFTKMYELQSEETISVVMGVYEAQDLYDLFPALIDSAVDQFIMEF